MPVWCSKAETDACYERCLERLFAAAPVVYPAVATHNPRSLALARVLAQEYGLGRDDYELQMLYGMAEDLRADLLDQVADTLTVRRDEFAAWQLFEGGKGWVEADADVAEAVDFLHFYAREARRLAAGRVRPYPGEDNLLEYRPLGVGAVLPPWNFPLAIPVGMLSAAIVAGNTVLFKPASLTPMVAYRFCELLRECGLPPGVVTLLPGEGAAVGEVLVRHPAPPSGPPAAGPEALRGGQSLPQPRHHPCHGRPPALRRLPP